MGKRGQRLARDAGDWVRHWGQGSRGLAGGQGDLTHQSGSMGSPVCVFVCVFVCVCVCVCVRGQRGVCTMRGGAQVEPLAGILPDIFVFSVLSGIFLLKLFLPSSALRGHLWSVFHLFCGIRKFF